MTFRIDKTANSEKKLWILALSNFEQALSRFSAVLSHSTEEADYVLDASIQRFEFCFELCWKVLKRYLSEEEKLEAKTPKQVFIKAYEIDLIENETIWLEMLDDRNLMSHTYREIDAEAVYSRLPNYMKRFSDIFSTLKQKI